MEMKEKFPDILGIIIKFHHKFRECCLGCKMWDDIIVRRNTVEFIMKYKKINGKPPPESCETQFAHCVFGKPLKYVFDFPLEEGDCVFVNLIGLQQQKNEAQPKLENVYASWH